MMMFSYFEPTKLAPLIRETKKSITTISCSLHFHTTIHKYAAHFLALSKNNVLHLVPKWWQLTFTMLILLLALITLIAPAKSKGSFTLK